MSTSINLPKDPALFPTSTSEYNRVATLSYSWRIFLDEQDPRIVREYDEERNETTFLILGLPINSRPERGWDEKGEELFGAKWAWTDGGTVVSLKLKGKVPFNPGWEINISSPAIVNPTKT